MEDSPGVHHPHPHHKVIRRQSPPQPPPTTGVAPPAKTSSKSSMVSRATTPTPPLGSDIHLYAQQQTTDYSTTYYKLANQYAKTIGKSKYFPKDFTTFLLITGGLVIVFPRMLLFILAGAVCFIIGFSFATPQTSLDSYYEQIRSRFNFQERDKLVELQLRSRKTGSDFITSAGISPPIDATLNKFLDKFTRDFINNWYKNLNHSQSIEFQNQIRSSMNVVFHNFSIFGRRINTISTTMTMCQAIILHIREYRNFESSSLSLQSYVSVNPSSPFAIMHSRPAVQQRLREIASHFVFNLLPREDKACPLVTSIVTEILATTVIEPLLELVSDPDFINRMLIKMLKSSDKSSGAGESNTNDNGSGKRRASHVVNSNHQIYVKVIEARHLTVDSSTTSNLYCSLMVGGDYTKTSKKRSEANPLWMEEFKFSVDPKHQEARQGKSWVDGVAIDVFAGKTFGVSDTRIGTVSIQTSSLPANKFIKQWFPLKNDKDELIGGELLLEVMYIEISIDMESLENDAPALTKTASDLSLVDTVEKETKKRELELEESAFLDALPLVEVFINGELLVQFMQFMHGQKADALVKFFMNSETYKNFASDLSSTRDALLQDAMSQFDLFFGPKAIHDVSKLIGYSSTDIAALKGKIENDVSAEVFDGVRGKVLEVIELKYWDGFKKSEEFDVWWKSKKKVLMTSALSPSAEKSFLRQQLPSPQDSSSSSSSSTSVTKHTEMANQQQRKQYSADAVTKDHGDSNSIRTRYGLFDQFGANSVDDLFVDENQDAVKDAQYTEDDSDDGDGDFEDDDDDDDDDEEQSSPSRSRSPSAQKRHRRKRRSKSKRRRNRQLSDSVTIVPDLKKTYQSDMETGAAPTVNFRLESEMAKLRLRQEKLLHDMERAQKDEGGQHFLIAALSSLREQVSVIDNIIDKAKRLGSSSTGRKSVDIAKLKSTRGSLMDQVKQLEEMAQAVSMNKDQQKIDLHNVQINVYEGGIENVNDVIGMVVFGKKEVFYIIQVLSLSSGKGWMKQKTYREFVDLHDKLKLQFPKVSKIPFPIPKTSFTSVVPLAAAVSSTMGISTNSTSSGSGLERDLERYLSMLVMDMVIAESTSLKEFLKPESVLSGGKHDNSLTADVDKLVANVFKTAGGLIKKVAAELPLVDMVMDNVISSGVGASSSSSSTAADKKTVTSFGSGGVQLPSQAYQGATHGVGANVVRASLPSSSSRLSQELDAVPMIMDDTMSGATTYVGDNDERSSMSISRSSNVLPRTKQLEPQPDMGLLSAPVTMNSVSATSSVVSSRAPTPMSIVSAVSASSSSSLSSAPSSPSSSSLSFRPRYLESTEIDILLECVFSLIEESFHLTDTNHWLRSKGLQVLKQVVRRTQGNAISNLVLESLDAYTSDEKIVQVIDAIDRVLWPNGKLFTKPKPRTPEECEDAKLEAKTLWLRSEMILGNEIVTKVIGRYNCVVGMTRMFNMLQVRELNRHLVITVFERLVKSLINGQV